MSGQVAAVIINALYFYYSRIDTGVPEVLGQPTPNGL